MRAAGLLVIAGCGRVGFGALAADSAPDALPAPFDAPFAAPTPIVELSSAGVDDDPSLTADQLEIYFMSDRSGTAALWRSTRAARDLPWDPPTEVPELVALNNPRVTSDGLAIYFSSRAAPAMATDLWVSRRPDRASTWGPPERIVELATAGEDLEPWAVDGELALYFTSARGGNHDFWAAHRTTIDEPFGLPVHLATISSPGYDGNAWVDTTETGMLFHSVRGAGSQLWRATRSDPTVPFDLPVVIAETESAGQEQDPWLSSDFRTLVFVSNRGGDYDLYIATR